MSFCPGITLITCLKGLKPQKSLFLSSGSDHTEKETSQQVNFLFNMVSWCGGHRRVHVGNYLVLCICLCIFQPPPSGGGGDKVHEEGSCDPDPIHSCLLSARPLASNPFMLCPIYASSGHLVFSSFGQICFGIWTNTVFNLDKYIWQFGQSGLHSCWVG